MTVLLTSRIVLQFRSTLTAWGESVLNTVFHITGLDRKTSDLMSAFLTYKGYNALVSKNWAYFFESTSNGDNRVLITGIPAAKSEPSDLLLMQMKADPRLIVIAHGKAESLRHLLTDQRLIHLPDPLSIDEFESVIMRVRELQTIKSNPAKSSADKYPHFLCSTIIGNSQQMLNLFETIEKVAESNATVLIQGESGTGKELAARAIHQLSSRKDKNFVPVNCAAIPDDLLESELFGHVKGAFTGAYSARIGRFELADKGTLFLDEIGDMKAALQVKLLRVLQSKEFEPVGSVKSQKIDARIIAASNKNLDDLVDNQTFREDLYYRLSVIPIIIPPLRERPEDIPLLLEHFQEQFNRERQHQITGFSPEATEMLLHHDWPGNVRELENLVERMITMKSSGIITVDDLPEKYLHQTEVKPASKLSDSVFTSAPTQQMGKNGICLNSAVNQLETDLILQALDRTGGNKKEAAALLNLKRTTLIEKIKKKNLSYP